MGPSRVRFYQSYQAQKKNKTDLRDDSLERQGETLAQTLQTKLYYFFQGGARTNTTPWKLRAGSPKNNPIEKEHHLNQTLIFGFNMLIFGGVLGGENGSDRN